VASWNPIARHETVARCLRVAGDGFGVPGPSAGLQRRRSSLRLTFGTVVCQAFYLASQLPQLTAYMRNVKVRRFKFLGQRPLVRHQVDDFSIWRIELQSR